jgi:hypothetical protein
MAKYKVCFEDKWQGTFDDRQEALDWAREVGETGRIVHVALIRPIRGPELIAIFPEDCVAEGQRAWNMRLLGSDTGPG